MKERERDESEIYSVVYGGIATELIMLNRLGKKFDGEDRLRKMLLDSSLGSDNEILSKEIIRKLYEENVKEEIVVFTKYGHKSLYPKPNEKVSGEVLSEYR